MTVKQFIADLGALIDAVCARVGQSRVVIFGHSWGSVLGQLYAARFPTKVAAYVGSGQIGDWQAGELASYQWALAEAQRTKNANALKELRAIGSPPHSVGNLWTERTWLQRFAGQFKAKALWKKKWDERYSADRNHLSSIYPTFCAASTSHLTLCGLKCLC
jgi:pimeloyl-ACP methyl ester carboxylesterase